LREFTYGHVRQLDAVLTRHLLALAARTPLLSGIGEQAYIDPDSLLRPVYGHHKQGASYGHSKIAGRQVLRKGLSPLAVAISTPTAAPVIAAVRLRAGRAGSGKGAASIITEAINTAKTAGAVNILVRGDSAYGNSDVITAVIKAGAQFSFVLTKNPAVNKTIDTIADDAWTPVHYPGSVIDPDTGELISDAEVAEISYTAFTSTTRKKRKKRDEVTARLIVRRVKDKNHLDALFPIWRHHPFFTNSAAPTVEADTTHRRHAIIETTFADLIDGPWTHMPSGIFPANAAWTVLSAIAHNLLRAAGALAAPHLSKARGATLRRQLVNVPARITRPQGTPTLAARRRLEHPVDQRIHRTQPTSSHLTPPAQATKAATRKQQWKSWTNQQPTHAQARSGTPQHQQHRTKINTAADPRIEVKPRRPCVWDESRSVVRRGDRIPAVIPIDKRLADRHACLNCGLWQDEPEDGLCVSCGSANLEIQERRIWGWLGIQRYLSPTDFGIDFIRNGRKILIRDTSLFRWVDPDDPGGRGDPEYPMEVPTGAGRIVGEIHIDHVRVNYQKNAFEYETPDWKTVVRTLRGDGPILPRSARDHGYGLNTSPLGRLVTGYRRNDPGLNYLTPGDGKNALHERAREWAERFRKGDPEYQTDEKWYQAAQQHDEPPAPPTDPVDEPTDILGAKGLNPPPPSPNGTPPPPRPEPTQVETEEDRRARWRAGGSLMPDLDAKFGLRGQGAALQVTAWLVHGQRLRRPDDPERIPVYVASGKGSAVEVFVEAEHPIFTDFAVDTRDLVVIELAEFLRVRNRTTERSLSALFYDLKEQCLPDHKVTGPFLSTNAGRLLTRVREGMQPVIAGNAAGYWGLVNPEDQAAAERAFALEGGYANWEDVLSSGDWIDYAPGGSLPRLVSARPESFLDGRVFRSAHQSLTDVEARKVSAERIVDLLGDVAVLADRPASRRGTSEELQRSRLSCVLLEQELVAAAGDGP